MEKPFFVGLKIVKPIKRLMSYPAAEECKRRIIKRVEDDGDESMGEEDVTSGTVTHDQIQELPHGSLTETLAITDVNGETITNLKDVTSGTVTHDSDQTRIQARELPNHAGSLTNPITYMNGETSTKDVNSGTVTHEKLAEDQIQDLTNHGSLTKSITYDPYSGDFANNSIALSSNWSASSSHSGNLGAEFSFANGDLNSSTLSLSKGGHIKFNST
jgi:hypothetical protein